MRQKSINNCIMCSREFQTFLGADDVLCSDACAEEAEEWAEQQAVSKKEERKTEKEKGKNMQTQNGALNTYPKKETKEQTIERLNAKDQGITTGKTETESYPDTELMLRSLEKESENIEGIGTLETKKTLPIEPSIVEESKTLQSALPDLQESLKRETLASMTMLSDLNKHLFHSMKRVTENDSGTMRLYDPERVRATAECGKQIISSMRMQLDVLKFAKEVHNETNA